MCVLPQLHHSQQKVIVSNCIGNNLFSFIDLLFIFDFCSGKKKGENILYVIKCSQITPVASRDDKSKSLTKVLF